MFFEACLGGDLLFHIEANLFDESTSRYYAACLGELSCFTYSIYRTYTGIYVFSDVFSSRGLDSSSYRQGPREHIQRLMRPLVQTGGNDKHTFQYGVVERCN